MNNNFPKNKKIKEFENEKKNKKNWTQIIKEKENFFYYLIITQLIFLYK